MTLPMILLGSPPAAEIGNKRLVRNGTPVTYASQVSAMTLPAASVFAGGIVLVQAVNRGGTTLPPTPSGWTLLASSSSASISKALFGKLTPVSENTTCSLGSAFYSGGIWAMKFEDGTAITRLAVDGAATTNIGSPGATSNTITRNNKGITQLNRFALASLYEKNDTAVALAFASMEPPGTFEEQIDLTTADDRHIVNVVNDATSIQSESAGTFTSTASGLTSANAYAHFALELNLNPLPAGALTAQYRNAQFSSTQQNAGVAYTWASNLLGPVGPDRYIVVCIGTAAVAGVNTAPTVTAVTIDGVALAPLVDLGITPGTGLRTALWGGYVDTANTSGALSVTFGATATRGCAVAVFSVHGSEDISVVDTDTDQYTSTGANFGAHTMVEDTDVWIGFGNHFGNTATFGWSVATETNELNYASANRTSSALMTLSGSRTPSFTCGSAGDGAACGVQLRGG